MKLLGEAQNDLPPLYWHCEPEQGGQRLQGAGDTILPQPAQIPHHPRVSPGDRNCGILPGKCEPPH